MFWFSLLINVDVLSSWSNCCFCFCFFFNCHNGLILKQGISSLALCSGMKVREKVEPSEKCKFYKDLRQCVSPVGDALQSENHEFLKIMLRIQPPSSVLTVWKWRTALAFMKPVSVKCHCVHPDLWLQRGRVFLQLRHETPSSGSSWFCWRLP